MRLTGAPSGRRRKTTSRSGAPTTRRSGGGGGRGQGAGDGNGHEGEAVWWRECRGQSIRRADYAAINSQNPKKYPSIDQRETLKGPEVWVIKVDFDTHVFFE